jgi:hypothetical protein
VVQRHIEGQIDREIHVVAIPGGAEHPQPPQ